MRILRLRADDTVSRSRSKLRLSMVHHISDEEAYIALPGTTALERTYPLFGYSLGGMFTPKHNPCVMVMAGDGFPLAVQEGADKAYRFDVDPDEDYEDQIDDAAYWEGQRKQQKGKGQSQAMPTAIMITMIGLAVPVILMGLFAGLPALLKAIGGES